MPETSTQKQLLLKLGFDEVAVDNIVAAELVEEAENLVRLGCSTELAWRILRP